MLRVPETALASTLAPAVSALEGPLRLGLAALVVTGVALALASRRMLSRRDVRPSATWGCGFASESARVQYTAASLSELALAAIAPRPLRPVARVVPPAGVFPRAAGFALEADDPARARVFEPAFRARGEWFGRLRRFQQARLNLQLLYTLLTVLALSALLLLHQRGP